MHPSKDKGKAPAHRPNPGDSRRRAVERAISRHYDKKKRRAQRRTLLDNPNLLNALQTIDESSTDDDSDEDQGSGNVSAPNRSEEEWDAIRRSNEAMLEELAQLRAMVTRESQLANSATPGASGSRSCNSAPKTEDTPVALGQPALDNPPACTPARRNPDPPTQALRSTPEERPRGFVALPKSKTAKNLRDIQNDAGLSDNNERWLEISNIIRDLMTRVGMDYDNSWLHQDKARMGILYSLILKEAPELGVFQNGWATEWLVQNKFNNHRYYVGNRKRKYSSIKAEEDDEYGRHPPPHPPPQALPWPADDEPGHGHEEANGPPPTKEDTPPLEALPPPVVLAPPEALPPPSRSLSRPPAAREPTLPPVLLPPGTASHLNPPTDRSSSSRPEGSRTRRPQNNTGTRYNTRTRAAALASAAAQTGAAAKQSDKQGKTARRTPKGKNQRHKSKSPLRLEEESDDGGRLTDEEDD